MASRRSTYTALLMALLVAPGCSPDLQDGLGPRVPVPNVLGMVVRAGEEAEDLEVELRTAETAVVTASTSTDDDGEFEFFEVQPGDWEIKVSGDDQGDFHAVSREFTLEETTDPVDLPATDIAAYGAQLSEPAAGATMPRPNPFQWLTFRWVLPESGVEWARVQVYDDQGESVWFSEEENSAEMAWNGLGNRGDSEGQAVPAGSYIWRVKMGLADGVEARLQSRELILE